MTIEEIEKATKEVGGAVTRVGKDEKYIFLQSPPNSSWKANMMQFIIVVLPPREGCDYFTVERAAAILSEGLKTWRR